MVATALLAARRERSTTPLAWQRVASPHKVLEPRRDRSTTPPAPNWPRTPLRSSVEHRTTPAVASRCQEFGSKSTIEKVGPKVTLHVYNTWCSNAAALAGITVVHTGVELLGWEFSFTQVGVRAAKPRMYDSKRHIAAIDLGHCTLRSGQVKNTLTLLSKLYQAEAYRVLGHNCQTFALDLIKRLGIDSSAIPEGYFTFARVERPQLLCGEPCCASGHGDDRGCCCSCWEDVECRSPTHHGVPRLSLNARPVLDSGRGGADAGAGRRADCDGGGQDAEWDYWEGAAPAEPQSGEAQVDERLEVAVMQHLRTVGGG